MDSDLPEIVGRFLVTAFFAVVFLQSAFDKITDSAGNIEFLREHFKHSPFPPDSVPLMFLALTALEVTAGALCGFGVLLGSFAYRGMNVAAAGVTLSGVALLALLLGQRWAKDYAGAAVVAAYFAVALVGIGFF